jgi:UDP-N-acetylmuramoylalanine--D-glutamate ligase
MFVIEDKKVLVIGLGLSGVAATELLLARGAEVTALDSADGESLRAQSMKLRERGVRVELGATALPLGKFDFAVVSPGVPMTHPLILEIRQRKIPLIGELELGYQQSFALNISITGTNGKTTTTELVERLLTTARRKTVAAGNIGLPLCAVADQTREMDFVTLEVSSFQLETIQFFRPMVAVLMNITPDHLDRYSSMEEYARAKARIFENQQAFDWAIVQSEALAQLRKLGVNIPSKVITFSATDPNADIYLERGLIISRIENFTGPLLNMDDVQLRGPHNAENIMAALGVGRVLRIALEDMVEAIRSYTPAPHRCELVAEINGVKFVNDSKATNVDAVAKALMGMPQFENSREPNVWLLAGGKDKGFDYHDLGPLLSRRVKGAFLFGETAQKISAAWSLFTPCSVVPTLLEAIAAAAKRAERGDVVLLSPACSSFDQFRNYQHRGEVFRQAVKHLEISGQKGHEGGSTNTRSTPMEALML